MKRKRILASFLAAVLLLSLLPAAFATEADGTSTTYTLTINNPDTTAGYEYKAYQIFKGNLVGNAAPYSLTDIKWGDGISEAGKTALATYFNVSVSQGESVNDDKYAAAIAEKMTQDAAPSVAKTINSNLGTVKATVAASTQSTVTVDGTEVTVNSYQFSFVEPGYYFIKNTAVPVGDGVYNKAFSDCILQVAGPVTVNPKIVLPTIGKQVWDEATDRQGENEWDETADHSINESFKFKITAKMSTSPYLDNYEKYKLVFHDTMSAGITFEQIDSVTIDGVTVNKGDGEGNYSYTTTVNDTTLLTITIPDAKTAIGEGKDIKGVDVVIIYSAHLNENAKTVTAPGTSNDPNQNQVYLEYSNYPHGDGTGDNVDNTGKTAPDIVHVFTYDVPVFKYHMVNDTETPLTDAGFKLYSDAAFKNEVKMTGSGGTYYPLQVKDADGTVINTNVTAVEMLPSSDGTFTIKGLDWGTYYLKETTVPEGYNSKTVKIEVGTASGQNHSETSDGASASVTYTLSADDMPIDTGSKIKIENRQGATLPTTGSIGTTIFYVLGSILVIGAVVLLVSKKRMNDAE